MKSISSAQAKLFPLEPGVLYLNHGSYGASPLSILEAQQQFRKRLHENPQAFFAFEYFDLVELAANRLCEFLGAKPERLAFSENASSAVCSILRSAVQSQLDSGDEIVTTSHCYGAVRKAIEYVALQTGAIVIEAPVSFPLKDTQTICDALSSAVTDKCKLVVIDHITSATGLIFPLEDILLSLDIDRTKVLVDGAHAPLAIDLNLEKLGALGVTWYVGNCHKWMCAPKGCAFIWSSERGQKDLHPTILSHGYGQGFREEFHWIGTRDPSAWLSLPATLEFLGDHDPQQIREYNNSLVSRAAALMAENWEQELILPLDAKGQPASACMHTLTIPGSWAGDDISARAFMKYLYDKHRIICQIYPFMDTLWLRLSAHIYNDYSQYETLAQVLSRAELQKIQSAISS